MNESRGDEQLRMNYSSSVSAGAKDCPDSFSKFKPNLM